MHGRCKLPLELSFSILCKLHWYFWLWTYLVDWVFPLNRTTLLQRHPGYSHLKRFNSFPFLFTRDTLLSQDRESAKHFDTAVERYLRGEASHIWEFLAFLHFAAKGGRINHSLYPVTVQEKKPIKLVLKNNSFYLLGCLKCSSDSSCSFIWRCGDYST